MFKFNVNTGNLVILSSKLEKLNKYALPVAIRGTLNKSAFDLKTNTMPISANKNFTNRSSNFFKANSRVEKANGFNVNRMQSETGFINSKLKGGNNYAVKDLQQQEEGGTIQGKSFIPLNSSRVSNSYSNNVRNANRLTNITKIVNARNQRGKTKGEKFIKAVLKAGAGGFVLGSENKGENILWRVNSLSSKIKTRKLDITPLYDYQKNRTIHVNNTNFMKEASLKTELKMPEFYKEEAKRQFDKVIK